MPHTTTLNKTEILSKLHQLPMIPVVIQEVLASFNTNNLNRTVLASKIELDQGLTAKVLRIANSSFYGLPRSIHSISDAVIVMGFNSVRSLVISSGFMRAFPLTPDSLFNRKAHWHRSFRVAGYARALAKCLNKDQEIVFTAGMFHDIGQMVLDVCIPEQFARILEQQKNTNANLLEIERAVLGCDHSEIGSEMAKRWNFPAEIERVIGDWRTPESAPFEPLNGLIFIAVLLESGLAEDALMKKIPPIVLKNLALDWACIASALPESEKLDEEARLLLSAV